jgi:hypothetical protein
MTSATSSLHAVEAAVEVAESFGLQVQQPLPLRSTNNIVAWLRPAPVVAKIRIGHDPDPGFRREIRVASKLQRLGAPVVAPASEVPAVVHSRNGFDITFWRYHPRPSDWAAPSATVASALRRLHEAYAQLSAELQGSLLSYFAELESVADLLRDGRRLAALPEADRLLLIRAFDRLKERLSALAPQSTHVAIHGSPHPFNILLVDGGPCFIDFESTCVGPREWDLAHTDSDVPLAYNATTNVELLQVCRDMVSLKTAAWCWADVDRGDLRYHAEIHLAHVKRSSPERHSR